MFQFNFEEILVTKRVDYSVYIDYPTRDTCSIILQVKSTAISIGTANGKIITIGTQVSDCGKPYLITDKKMPYLGTKTHAAANNGKLLCMDYQGLIKIWEDIGVNKRATTFVTFPEATSCAQTNADHVYVSDPSNKTIIKYNLTGKAVLLLKHAEMTSPDLIVGDAKRNRLYVFNKKDSQLQMFASDNHQWAVKLMSYVKLAVREEDGIIFFIGNRCIVDGQKKDHRFHLVVVNPSTGEWVAG